MVVSSSTVNTDGPAIREKLGIREIHETDIPDVTNVLTRGFPCPRRYWETALERLRTRSTPTEFPRYGYMLEADGKPVGVVLLISSVRDVNGHPEFFSNLSSWYVDPSYRSHAPQLLRRALTHKQTTFLSISAATHVRPIYEAFGFKRYSAGQVLTAPAIARNRASRARIYGADQLGESGLALPERRLLELQSSYNCISLCAVTNGQTHPFVFLPRKIRRFVPCAQLVYCRSVNDFVEVAGSVGRHLLSLGWPFVLIDADGPISGLPGKYFDNATPKYFKGPATPVVGDLSETEATIFGIWSAADR